MGVGVCSTCFPYANLPFHYCGCNRLVAEKRAHALVFFLFAQTLLQKRRGLKVVVKEIYVVYIVPPISHIRVMTIYLPDVISKIRE
jgi:hypothetical protein